jgi:hypothetical protein
MADIVELVDAFISADDQRSWTKMSNAMNPRALEILLLREIVVELRKLNVSKEPSINEFETGTQAD